MSTAARMIGFTSLLVLVLALAYASTRADGVIPTNEWVNFHSFNTIFAGQPVSVGAYIAAYDPDGVQCGEFTVVEAGKYGVMPVYRDDDTTPDVDEGAEPGDLITFTINGWSAVALGPDDPIWTSHGDLLEVDLDVAAAPTSTATPTETPTATPTATGTATPTATSTPIPSPTPPPIPVGGVIVPVNKLELLAPWLGLVALAALATLTVALVRRRRG